MVTRIRLMTPCTKSLFMDINAAVTVQQKREHIAYTFKEFSQQVQPRHFEYIQYFNFNESSQGNSFYERNLQSNRKLQRKTLMEHHSSDSREKKTKAITETVEQELMSNREQTVYSKGDSARSLCKSSGNVCER